jgi:hypothetical protein
MEEEPPQAPLLPVPFVKPEIPVFVVPQHGVPQPGKMPPDLVHTPRTQFQFQKGILRLPPGVFPGIALRGAASGRGGKDPVGGERRFRPAPYVQALLYGPPRGMGKAGADRKVEFPYGAGAPPQAASKPAGKTARKAAGKPGRGLPVFCHEDHPRGIPVQPVNQEGPFPKGRRQQGIQGDPYPLPSLNRQARGLVEDETIIIFKENSYIFSKFHTICGSASRL